MLSRQFRKSIAASVVASTLAGFGLSVSAAEPAPTPLAPAIYTFGTLRALKIEDAKAKAETYLKSVGKFDAAAFAKIWSNEARTILDRTVDSLAMANPEVASLLKTAKNPEADPPAELPKFLTDEKADPFFKANIATAYAKALSGKRVYEESLDALKMVQPEQVVDPATYYFYKAVSEHALIMKDQAVASIVRLLDDVADTPDRYKMVATLMFFDMQNWSADAKDLSNIGRLMDNSGRRLELARGGQKTQEIQKKIVFRLDEKIKELENQAKGKGSGNGGSCPDGKGDQPGANPGQGNPAQDGYVGGVAGEGKVDEKKLKKLAESWGELPPAERAKAITEITRDLPPKFKPMIEEYFKSLNKLHNVKP